jgi:hypothetical protein
LRHRVVATLAALILASAAWALDDPKDKAGTDPPAKSETVAEKLSTLQKEMQKTRTELLEKLKEAEKDEEKQEIRKELNGLNRKFAGRYLELAEQNPKDPAAGQALALVLTSASGTPEANKAVEMIVKDQIYDPPVIAMLPLLSRMGGPNAERLLRGAAGHAKSNDDRGNATMALAQFVKGKADRATGDEAEKLSAEAEKLFETVVEKYADVKSGRGTTLGAQAKPELFEMRHLSVGKTVPEIEAEDIDGTKFKLSDYRGKVVLLDFWGNW